MKFRFQLYIQHILTCAAFLILPYIFTLNDQVGWPDLLHSKHDMTDFAIYLVLLAFCYINFYVLVPKLIITKKYILYVLITVFFILGVIVMGTGIDSKGFSNFFSLGSSRPPQHHGHPPDEAGRSAVAAAHPPPFSTSDIHHRYPPPPPDAHENNEDMPSVTNAKPSPEGGNLHAQSKPQYMRIQVSHTIFLYLTGLLASLFLAVNKHYMQLEKEKSQTELSFLKAQINPHFLFNTLNSIYALAITKDDKTADAVVKLSEFMRFIIRDAGSDKVLLEKEINYITNYIELQKSRWGDSANVEYSVEGNTNGKQIAPLILISFIENAFKHGVNPDDNSEIRVMINIKQNELSLYVSNRIVRFEQDMAGSGTIGLANVKERLSLIYRDKHQLVLHDDGNFYIVKLIINLE